ncbi:hypothetical protein OU800_14235 [Pseudomonas sp. GOM7]|uniref:hypothetical protein n=1 Tax=Pseudomonas sp. GOM7 TaxID=2998079 RepID=UPI00227C8D1E|nr:hypothetical protein [Pseudomonas sp. GOM7]WAJ35790.1 hypothetical protein OU800_14235 [Pseudomonas sp. GOM7]
MKPKFLLLLLCLAWLSACERAPQPVAQQPEPAQVAPVPTPVEAPAKPKPVAPVPVKAIEAKSVVAPGKAPVAVKPQPAPAQPKPVEPAAAQALDLSVPHELFEQALQSKTEQELKPLLPPLFGEKPESSGPFQISGKLINNARVDDYWDSIEGAEVQFEFKQ